MKNSMVRGGHKTVTMEALTYLYVVSRDNFIIALTKLKNISEIAWERRRQESGRLGKGEGREEELGSGSDG